MSFKYEKITQFFSKNRMYSAIFLLLCICPISMLVVQYFCMRNAITRLLEYQDDYRSYAMTLKRMIREKAKTNSEDSQAEAKKKNLNFRT